MSFPLFNPSSGIFPSVEIHLLNILLPCLLFCILWFIRRHKNRRRAHACSDTESAISDPSSKVSGADFLNFEKRIDPRVHDPRNGYHEDSPSYYNTKIILDLTPSLHSAHMAAKTFPDEGRWHLPDTAAPSPSHHDAPRSQQSPYPYHYESSSFRGPSRRASYPQQGGHNSKPQTRHGLLGRHSRMDEIQYFHDASDHHHPDVVWKRRTLTFLT
ncbi:hypothetical protein ABEF92_000096 [Exophiala dermatitidis]|uniref:Uncharacterized protein n=1 Tax=Exophiala dermatitidis (strain ATCC 34100 / CBS 525.76 / NIH/UT8656) TaxID=858893 RepID=H6C9F1_EXODN|nr:uncharacterized protein HMPREF1120_08669 [Exophiala dermatitidis NIH/UT8656]EHY60721.1 hypothetical protein HMPREF1120_08669 [Exophiala dermatitidis NIH/UT8656]